MNEDSAAHRYRRAKAIALEALDRAPSERQSFIDQRCGDRETLRKEVRWLVEAAEDSSVDEVPERFQAAATQALKNVSLEVPLPRNYRLIRRLDQGGMGIVYLAERVDGDIRQRVALKLLHPSGKTGESLAAGQFKTEQRILSRLGHPNIARLIDAGLTGEGRPFMATEYVDGERIDHWCARHGSGIQERLVLFLKVCAAVDYAHRHMVIHRDIKPANILVTAQGEPKLLDFGIARALDGPDEGGSAIRTQAQALTMAYASPEQISGESLSAASDVYSLGVVLYELLTGIQPFDHVESDRDLHAAILAGEFEAPREQSADAVGGRVARDLDAIVVKAMSCRAEQRYASAEALADDIRRFLDHRPVRARGNHALYRARRFVRRHRWGVAAGIGVAAMLLVFLVDREMQLERIAWERDRAEAVTEFMNGMFAGADSLPSRGSEVTVREILDLGAGQLSSVDHDSPALLGSMYLALGQSYNALGLGEKALPLLREAQAALAPSLPPGQKALIQAEVGAALDSGGRAIEAIAADRRAIELFEAASGDFAEDILRVRIRKLRNHANVLDVPLAQTISELIGVIGEIEARSDAPGDLLFEAKAALVGAHVVDGAASDALETAVQARSLAERLFEPGDPRRLRGRYVHATALLLEDPETAVEMYKSLVDDYERLIGPSQRLANRIGNFGVALSRVGRDRESMQAFSRSAEMIEDLAGRDHYLYRLSISNLAALHLRQGEPQEAEALVRTILVDRERRTGRPGGAEIRYRASALDILGSALTLQGRLDEAAEVYGQALALLDLDSGAEWPELEAAISARLAEVERELGSR